MQYPVWKVTYSCSCPGDRPNSRYKQQYFVAAATSDEAREQCDVLFGIDDLTRAELAQGTVRKTVTSYQQRIVFPTIQGTYAAAGDRTIQPRAEADGTMILEFLVSKD